MKEYLNKKMMETMNEIIMKDERSVIFMLWYQEMLESIDNKDKELKDKLLMVKQDYKKLIESKDAEFNEKLVEFERIFKQKDDKEVENEIVDEEKSRTRRIIDHAMKNDFIYKGLSITEKGNLLVEVENEEIVTRETKRRYSRYLEEKLEEIEKTEEKIPELVGLRRQFAINEVITGEKMADKEARRVSSMIVVDKEAKLFAKY